MYSQLSVRKPTGERRGDLMKKSWKISEDEFEESLWSVSKLVCWTLSLLLGFLLFVTVPWVIVIVGLLGISFFVDMKIKEDDDG